MSDEAASAATDKKRFFHLARDQSNVLQELALLWQFSGLSGFPNRYFNDS
jgi:hypothetical protein